jgi:hypothetical protein
VGSRISCDRRTPVGYLPILSFLRGCAATVSLFGIAPRQHTATCGVKYLPASSSTSTNRPESGPGESRRPIKYDLNLPSRVTCSDAGVVGRPWNQTLRWAPFSLPDADGAGDRYTTTDGVHLHLPMNAAECTDPAERHQLRRATASHRCLVQVALPRCPAPEKRGVQSSRQPAFHDQDPIEIDDA